MRCETMQRAVSERMDGERIPADLASGLEAHLSSCRACLAFLHDAQRLRGTARIRPAEDVPDLTTSVMRAVARNRAQVRWPRNRAQVRWPRNRLAPIAAALVVGLIAGSVVVGGPWQRPSTTPIAMAAVIRSSQAAAGALPAYRATFAIVERGLSPEVPERHLSMDVAFRAPERYRVDIRDQTTYPSAAWTPTDLTYVADGRATYRRGPTGCPSDLPVGTCPPTRATVVRTSASSVDTSPPSDLVIPLTTLGETPGVVVTGTGTVSGRPAVRVELPFERAEPLFSFMGLGGRWRPFFPSDRVDLWLDADRWFPLRYTVYPSQDPRRRSWELRFGLPTEPSSAWIFDVRATAVTDAPAASWFRIPGIPQVRPIPLSRLEERLGYAPVTPAPPEGFRLRAALVHGKGDAAAPISILSYTRGLSYLVVAEHPGPGLGGFGDADPEAEWVHLPNGITAYYAPATRDHGRTLSIRSGGVSLYLETNLTRTELLATAGSLAIVIDTSAGTPG